MLDMFPFLQSVLNKFHSCQLADMTVFLEIKYDMPERAQSLFPKCKGHMALGSEHSFMSIN